MLRPHRAALALAPAAVAAALRDLFGNPSGLPADPAWPLQHAIPVAIAWCVAIVAICAPLDVASYRRATR